MPPKYEEGKSIQYYINTLRYASKRNRRYSFIVLILTMFSAVLCVAQVSGFLSLFRIGILRVELVALLAQAIIFLFVAVVLFNFDVRRKSGAIVLQELSDQLHWKSDRVGDKEMDSLEIRILLRKLSGSESLPFVPRDAGPSIYILVHLSLLLLSGFVFRTVFS